MLLYFQILSLYSVARWLLLYLLFVKLYMSGYQFSLKHSVGLRPCHCLLVLGHRTLLIALADRARLRHWGPMLKGHGGPSPSKIVSKSTTWSHRGFLLIMVSFRLFWTFSKSNIIQCPTFTNAYWDLNIKKSCRQRGPSLNRGAMPWHNWHTS